VTDVADPRHGDRVRVQCGATGRYLGKGLALVVSMGNDLFVDRVDLDGAPPHPTLPVPSCDALAGAAAVLWSSKVGTATTPPGAA
jgi:hypothetical protein